MQAAVWEALGSELASADALVMAAAVADHRPAQVSAHKIKKGDAASAIDLVKNPDILGEVGARRMGARPVLVGFAVETAGGEDLLAYARRKLSSKRVDLVVANQAESAFGRDDNVATLVTASEVEPLEAMPKAALADVVLDRVRALWRRGE
jgi:phosphopantothenoylcysteine decarboxylase/phosphopantothenate--cysteine ligase